LAPKWFFERRASYHFKASEFRNWRPFEFLNSLFFPLTLTFRNLKITKLSLLIIQIKQLRYFSNSYQQKNEIFKKYLFSIIEKFEYFPISKFLRFKMIWSSPKNGVKNTSPLSEDNHKYKLTPLICIASGLKRPD